MEVAIVLASHRGRAAELAVVFRVLTKPEAAHNLIHPNNRNVTADEDPDAPPQRPQTRRRRRARMAADDERPFSG